MNCNSSDLLRYCSLSITFFTLTSFLSLRYIFFRSSTTFSGVKSSSLSMHPPSKDRFVSPLLPFLEQTLGVQKYCGFAILSVNLLCGCDLFNLARSCVCASWKLGYWKFRVSKLCVSPFFFLSIMVFSPLYRFYGKTMAKAAGVFFFLSIMVFSPLYTFLTISGEDSFGWGLRNGC